MSKLPRLFLAACLGLAGPCLIGFDTHGVPALVSRYYTTAQALWVGIHGDPLILGSAAIHLVIYAGFAYFFFRGSPVVATSQAPPNMALQRTRGLVAFRLVLGTGRFSATGSPPGGRSPLNAGSLGSGR